MEIDQNLTESSEPIVVMPCETGNCADPGDFFFGRKWDLHNTGTIVTNSGNATVLATTGAAGADVDWLEAFDALGGFGFTGSAIVGIIDTGILPTHVDLAGKVIAAQNFATGYPATLIEDRDTTHGSTPLGWCFHGAAHRRNPAGDYAAVARLLLEAGARVGPNQDDAPADVLAVVRAIAG